MMKSLIDPKKRAEVLKALNKGDIAGVFTHKDPARKPVGSPSNEGIAGKVLSSLEKEDLNARLRNALKYGYDDEEAKRLLRAGADVNLRRADGWTILMSAANTDSMMAVRFLIENGAHVDAQEDNGYTPLMLAIMGKRMENVEKLLECGADVNIRDKNGCTALGFAFGKPEFIAILKAYGATE